MNCPACGAKQRDGAATCSACQADLSLLVAYGSLAESFYDEALRLARIEGGTESALKSLHLAVALDPEHVDAHVVLGKLHAQRGDYQQAIHGWQRALELAREGSPSREKALKGIAKAQQLLAQHADAEAAAQQRQQRAARAARWRRRVGAGALLVGVLVAGLIGGSSLRGLKTVPLGDAARAIAHAVREHPALAGDHLKVQAIGDRVAIEGRVSDEQHRDLVSAIAAQFSGRNRVDLSGVHVYAEPAAAALQRALAALCHQAPGRGGAAGVSGPLADLAAGQVTVIAADNGKLRMVGTVPTPDARRVVEQLASSLVEPGQLDASALKVAEDYVIHVVQPGECPYTIARQRCGDASKLAALREFCEENAKALRDPRRVRPGTLLRIPKRLLASAQ